MHNIGKLQTQLSQEYKAVFLSNNWYMWDTSQPNSDACESIVLFQQTLNCVKLLVLSVLVSKPVQSTCQL